MHCRFRVRHRRESVLCKRYWSCKMGVRGKGAVRYQVVAMIEIRSSGRCSRRQTGKPVP